MGWHDGKNAKTWAGTYKDIVGGLEVKDYEKLVVFGKRHDLQLPLRTVAEEKWWMAQLTQTKEGVERLEREKWEGISRSTDGYKKNLD